MGSWIPKYVVGIVMPVCMCAWFSGCATAPVTGPASNTFVDRTGEIVVTPPLIEYRNVRTNDFLEAAADDRARVERAVGELVIDQLKANGFTARLLTAEEIVRLHRTANGWALCDEPVAPRLFCLRGRFYVGPGAFWDPMSGAIARGGSRIVLEGRLTSSAESRLVWAQTAQVRESADVSRAALKDTVEVLLKTLKAQ
jgi:hypothetical protein